MKTKHLKWLLPLVLLPVLRTEVAAQTETRVDTIVVSDTLRWTWTAKEGEVKDFAFSVTTLGYYQVRWGDGDMKDILVVSIPQTVSHQYVQESGYDVAVCGIAAYQFNGYTETAIGIDMEMVYVEGGTFEMGATAEQGDDAYDDEKPVHSVTLDGFHIGKYEVTQAQWNAVMGTKPSSFKGDNLPVENVSWEKAQAFCKKLSETTGKTYRLPTEAEWEYAARGGNQSQHYKYAGSNDIDEVAWYTNNSGGETHPVGTKKANELGIYDMSGNVCEWCSDSYVKDYYSSSPAVNPQAPATGVAPVKRGGSWSPYASGYRVSNRDCCYPVLGKGYHGFRVACSSK